MNKLKLGVYFFKGVGWGLQEFIEIFKNIFEIFYIKDISSYYLLDLDGILITGGQNYAIKNSLSKKAPKPFLDGYKNLVSIFSGSAKDFKMSKMLFA